MKMFEVHNHSLFFLIKQFRRNMIQCQHLIVYRAELAHTNGENLSSQL